ncbi:hypothetical protein LVJ83_05945 [Uruburuella testudinis]|uniref:Uncharacterized protein n=1 Tax=Uruburuella testudinis TaxID=1282863 RepID=A0ABY4DVD3_9NEIS|nr:hypothetical protein [Uruburuella testudinis]UOO82998.1 hypothetical protein LVJ83_05945 [Uruburuella testudinis]
MSEHPNTQQLSDGLQTPAKAKFLILLPNTQQLSDGLQTGRLKIRRRPPEFVKLNIHYSKTTSC